MIFNTVNSRSSYLFSKLNNKNRIIINYKVNNKKKKNWFTIPYIQAISYRFKNITKDFKANLAFFSLNKLGYIVKDILPKSSQKNVVYKLSCKDCNATYVGQTCRKLKTRINEHKNHICRKTATELVITEHRLSLNHDFDWENVTILDKKSFWGNF